MNQVRHIIIVAVSIVSSLGCKQDTPIKKDNQGNSNVVCEIPEYDPGGPDYCKMFTSESRNFYTIERLKECGLGQIKESVGCTDGGKLSDTSEPAKQDHCNCDAKTCKDGENCLNIVVDMGQACGQPIMRNRCVIACRGDEDCQEGERCVPGFLGSYSAPTCIPAKCRSDKDCQDGFCGKCGVVTQKVSQCFPNLAQSVECIYQK